LTSIANNWYKVILEKMHYDAFAESYLFPDGSIFADLSSFYWMGKTSVCNDVFFLTFAYASFDDN